MSPGLNGTGRIADDLFLLAHNDITGKPFIRPRPLGLGLAGGLLAELIVADVISVDSDEIAVRVNSRPPTDELATHALELLADEWGSHPVRDWLAYLARTAAADVAKRLEASGYLAPDRGLLPWRGGRWVPVDRDSAFAPVLRVRAALDATQRPTIHEVVLAGLADACGLWFRLAEYTPIGAVRPLYRAVAQLDPGLHDLIAHTRTAVDSAVLAHRTGARG